MANLAYRPYEKYIQANNKMRHFIKYMHKIWGNTSQKKINKIIHESA